MQILSDYYWESADKHLFGIFVFARDDRLAGLEVWSTDGLSISTSLPAPEELDQLHAWNE